MNTDTYVTVRRPVGVDSTSTSTSSTVSQPSGSGFFKRSLNANANSRQTCSSPYIVTVILLLLILTWIGASIDFWSHHHQQQQQGEGLNFNSEAIGIEQVTSPSPPPTLTQTINTNQKQSQQIITTPSVPCPTSTSVVSSASPATSICRPGTQRCITGSTATSYSRFNLLATSKSENHGRLSSTNHARSQAPYDVDGTPKFRERLEAYTVEHRRATDVAGMIAEIRQDTGIMTGKSEILVKAFEKRIGRERYTVFIDGPSGLGNKLLPLVSTFGYSLLTNRTLLWHLFPSALEELLHFGPTADLTPEQKSSGMEASSILEGSMTKFMSDLITAYREIDPAYTSSNTDPRQPPSSNGGAHWTDKVAIALFHSPLPPVEDSAYPSWKSFPAFVAHFPRAFQFTSYDMRSPDSGRVKASFVCQDVIMRDTASWLVYTTSDQYWLPTMAGNSFTRPTLVSWVNEGNMYGPLARWLLNWNSNAIRQVANEFARRHFGSYTIGLQFRLRERMQLTTSEIRIAVQAAIQLAATYQGAYDPEFDGPPNLNPTKYFGLELVPNDVRRQQLAVDPTGTRQLGATHYRGYVPGQNDFPENGPRPFVTFFIATDDLNVRQRLKTMLEPYGQVALPPSDSNSRDESGSGLRGAYYVKKDNVGALKWAIIENLLLSSCDDILVSPTSTYGYSAYGYGSLVPHRILLDPTGYVLRHLTSEPMAHFWKPLFREVTQMELCRVENDLPSFGQGDECCPRWGSGARIPPDGI